MSRDGGYIKLYRRIVRGVEHGGDDLWNEPRVWSRAEAWTYLMLTAAYAPHSKLVKGRIVQIDRGEFQASQRFLAEKWGWSKTAVLRFLDLLENQLGRIKQKPSEKRTTTGTTYLIVNYERYQGERTSDGPVTDQSRTSDGPKDKKVEEGEEGKKEESSPAASGAGDVGDVWQAYLSAHHEFYARKNGRPGNSPSLTNTRRELIRKSLRDYPKADVIDAVKGIFRSTYHAGDNDSGKTYLDIEVALSVNRSRNNIERFRELERTPPQPGQGGQRRLALASPYPYRKLP